MNVNWAEQLVDCKQALTKLEEVSRSGRLVDVMPAAQSLAIKADTLYQTLFVARLMGAA